MNEELIIRSLFLLGIYLLPTIIGYSRAKKNTLAIFILNFTLGWTIIGWIIALIWACTYEEGRGHLAKGRPSWLLKIILVMLIAVPFLKGMFEASLGYELTWGQFSLVFILVCLLAYLAYHKKWIKFKK